MTSKKQNKNKRNNKVQLRKQVEKWKQIPPRPNEAKEKFWRGKKYYYCGEHQAWGHHQEKDCTEKCKRLQKKAKSDEKNRKLGSNMALFDQENMLSSLEEIMMEW